MSELRYDGKVVLVTGAGNGLGRSHALGFARRGAKIVVNDLGGSHTGEGQSKGAADHVVDEIRAKGGEAVANYDSVEDGEKIVKTAIDTFGRLDVVVNNAGVLRDVSFQKMTWDDFRLVERVHLDGAFRVTHAAWPIMREQKYGRILFTSSAAGLYGNFGQANYSAAKLGLVGLMQTLAIEGRKNNVFVNAIAPVAASRMTETVLPKELLDALDPAYVTQLVLWLAHERCEETGSTFEVGGGFYAKLRFERTKGVTFRLGRPVSAEDLEARWGEIRSFEEATHPEGINQALDPILDNVKAGPSKGGNRFIDVDQALGYEYPEMRTSYDERDLSLYALGVGAAADPLDEKDLKLVYEFHGDGFVGLPTYGVVPALKCIFDLGKEGKTAPGMHFGLDRVLHGEQYLRVTRPLPPHANLTHKARIKAIYDKGSEGGKKGGAVVVTAFESRDDSGEVLFENEITTFVRGAGGWGGDRGPDDKNLNAPPDRAPDAVVEQAIPANQALLYRLSGDWNPLHADPSFAKAFGYERPILHGLCTFGYAVRHVLSNFAKGGDPRYFESVKVRFAKPVLPGETIVTEMWRESDRKILFRVKVKGRDEIVLSNAAVTLYDEIPKPAAKTTRPASEASSKGASEASAQPTSADVFQGIGAYLKKAGGQGDKIKTVYQFRLSNPDAIYTIDLSAGDGSVSVGESASAGCTLEITDADFMDMASGKADAMKLFTSGKLKISGNIMASQKLDFLRKVDPADVLKAMQARTGGGVSASASSDAKASVEPAAAKAADTSKASVEALAARLRTAKLDEGVPGTIALVVKESGARYTIDLAARPVTIIEGGPESASATLTLGAAALAAFAEAKSSLEALYQRGEARIDGDVARVRRLGAALRS